MFHTDNPDAIIFIPSPTSFPIQAGHLCIVYFMQICNPTSNLHKNGRFFIFFYFDLETQPFLCKFAIQFQICINNGQG